MDLSGLINPDALKEIVDRLFSENRIVRMTTQYGEAVTVQEAAKILGCCRSTISAMLADGRLNKTPDNKVDVQSISCMFLLVKQCLSSSPNVCRCGATPSGICSCVCACAAGAQALPGSLPDPFPEAGRADLASLPPARNPY